MSKTVFIGNASAYTTAANPNALGSGEIGVYSIGSDGTFTRIVDNSTNSNGAANTTVKLLPLLIAQGVSSGTTTNYRGVILQPRSVIAGSVPTTATSYVPPIPNIYTLGYTGVSGNTDTIVGGIAGSYGLNITNTSKGIPPFPYTSWNKSYPATSGTTAASATAPNISYDITKGINANTLNNIATGALPEESFVWAATISNATRTYNVLSTAGTLSLTGGSTSATCTVTAATTGIIAGDYLAIGGITATSATNSTGSATATFASTANMVAGMTMIVNSGAGVLAAGTTILSVDSATSITMSAVSSTGLGSNSAITFYSPGAQLLKVASVSGTSITFDSPFVAGGIAVGATVTGVSYARVTAANYAAATYVGNRFVEWGNSFNGSPVTQLMPNKTMFAFASGLLYDLGNVISNNVTAAKPYISSTGTMASGVYFEGQGRGYQVQKEEFISMGYFGMNNRVFLPFSNPYYASSTSNYDGFAFKYNGLWEDKTAGGYSRSEVNEVEIFCITPATDAGDTLASAVVPAIIAAYAA